MPNKQLLLEPEYLDVYDAWYNKPSAETRAAMAKALLPLIKRSVLSSGGDPNNPVVLAKGRMIAMQALKRYDPYSAKLGNFMTSQLMGLNRALGTQNNIISVPEAVVLDKKKLNAAEEELLDQLGRYPSTTELADYTGLSVKRIAKIRQANVPMASSQFKSPEGETFAPGAHILGDTSREDAWQEYVYDSLDDRKRSIMERLYGMHGLQQKTPIEIAKELGISTAAVSQQRKKIDDALNSELQFSIFGN